jgi:hypothetical protein
MLLPLDAPIGESQKMPEFTAFLARRDRAAPRKRRFKGIICDIGTEIATFGTRGAFAALLRTPYFMG